MTLSKSKMKWVYLHFQIHILERGTKLIMEKAESLGFKTQKMPKFINPETCKPCGKCAFGCPRDSKWTSMIMWMMQ